MRSRFRALSWVLCISSLLVILAGCSKRSVDLNAVEAAAGAPGANAEAQAESTKSAEPNSQGGNYQFPEVPGKDRLIKLLVPADWVPGSAPEPRYGPLTLPSPASLARVQLPLPLAEPALPRLPLAPSPPVQPRLLPGEPPLSRSRLELRQPQRVELPAGAGVRLRIDDGDQPVPLPILAQEQVDRASLDDPTAEASVQFALAAPLPQRTEPAPFLRLNLPDPFEHGRVVRLAVAPREKPDPPGAAPAPPGR